jgi:DNA-binding Lrp family transcriptional regulator
MERPVLERLKKIASVRESYSTFGIYDIISLAETEKMEETTRVITERIRKLPDVRTTLTMMIVRLEKSKKNHRYSAKTKTSANNAPAGHAT